MRHKLNNNNSNMPWARKVIVDVWFSRTTVKSSRQMHDFGEAKNSKISIKNIPFQATKTELEQLFKWVARVQLALGLTIVHLWRVSFMTRHNSAEKLR